MAIGCWKWRSVAAYLKKLWKKLRNISVSLWMSEVQLLLGQESKLQTRLLCYIRTGGRWGRVGSTNGLQMCVCIFWNGRRGRGFSHRGRPLFVLYTQDCSETCNHPHTHPHTHTGQQHSIFPKTVFVSHAVIWTMSSSCKINLQEKDAE